MEPWRFLQVPARAWDEEVGHEWQNCPLTSSVTDNLHVITEVAHCFRLRTSSIEKATDKEVGLGWRYCPLVFITSPIICDYRASTLLPPPSSSGLSPGTLHHLGWGPSINRAGTLLSMPLLVKRPWPGLTRLREIAGEIAVSWEMRIYDPWGTSPFLRAR